MSSIFYAVFVLAVLGVIRWYITNDNEADGSIGLLAMTTRRVAREPKRGRKSRYSRKKNSNGQSPQ